MVEYTCEKCNKVFKNKSSYTKHQNRKTSCENDVLKVKKVKEVKEVKKVKETDVLKVEGLSETVYTDNKDIDIQNIDGMQYLPEIDKNSVDLILTDPPYITSSETGMGNLHKQIKENKKNGVEFVKSEEEWDLVKEKYIDKKDMTEEKMKDNYMKFGSIFGSKYSVQTEYGEWDTSFTMEKLDVFIKEYYISFIVIESNTNKITCVHVKCSPTLVMNR